MSNEFLDDTRNLLSYIEQDLTNYQNVQYYANVAVGTPAKNFTFLFDTGSSVRNLLPKLTTDCLVTQFELHTLLVWKQSPEYLVKLNICYKLCSSKHLGRTFS